MGAPIGPQSLDESRTYRLTLSGSPAAPSLLGHFTGAETFGAKLWPGGTYPASATLAAAWATTDAAGNALAGNPASLASPILNLTITKAAIAGLTPGTYQVEVIASPGTVDELLYSGSIRLDAGIGSTAFARTYCGLQDMRDEFSGLDQVENLDDSRAAQFRPEREEAARWLERQCMARWSRAIRDQAMRHSPIQCSTPITNTTGIDDGPSWGDSATEDTTYRDAETAFSALLDTTGLMLDYGPDRGRLRKVAALYSLYLALDDQLGKAADETSYQVVAQKYRTRALRAMYGLEFRVDSDADGLPNYRLRP